MRAALVAMALLAGCGGGGAEKPAAEPALPPAEPTPDAGAAAAVDLSVGLPEDPPPQADGTPPKTVALADLEPFRLSGDLAGLEPDAADGRRRALIAKLCLDITGVPSAIKLLKSTGDAAFDRRVLVRLTEWRFKPYLIETEPFAACTVVVATITAPTP